MEQSNVLVSVIVPVYNVEKYIDKCIESIINQTYEHLQIILVDDGSTDKSGEICDRYAEKDGRVEVIHNEHSGTVVTRKKGASDAKGKYTVCVDGDDWIDKDTIETYVEIWDKYDVDIIMTTAHYNNYESRQEIISEIIQDGYVGCDEYTERVFPYLLGDDEDKGRVLAYSLCYNSFKTELLRRCQQKVNNDICCGEDGACFFRCLSESRNVYIANICKYHYVHRKDSASHQIHIQAEVELKALYQDVIRALQGSRYEIELKRKAMRLIHENIMFSNLNIYWKYNPESLFPFVEVNAGSKIVLYGAGSVGQQMYQSLQQYKDYYQIVGWVDQQWEYYKEKGYPVNNVTMINNMEYDYIIVTLINKKIANTIKNNLMNMNIEKNKIITINLNVFNEENIPFK